ncbi:MAG: [FeFe] hydrogenase H-cluster radical SAM maturase HydE, partial [Coriobacteriales bacterium]
MDSRTEALGYELLENHSLAVEDYEHLLRNRDMESARFLADLALSERKRVYGAGIFIRGLIEFTNCCKNDCYYCGLRASNKSCDRYRLTKEQILDCCDSGYKLGFRTFVLQGGEDPMISDDFM